MSYAFNFCPLSGCCPAVADYLHDNWGAQGAVKAISNRLERNRLRTALRLLEKEEDGRAVVTVIGPIDPDGQPVYPLESSFVGLTDDDLQQHADSLRIMPWCTYNGDFAAGKKSGLHYFLHYGPCLFVMSAALPILYLATDGRVMLKHIWRLSMRQGRMEREGEPLLEGVNYGAVKPQVQDLLDPSLELELKEAEWDDAGMVAGWLKRAKYLDELKELLRLEGGFWLWTAPDDFPLVPVFPPADLPRFTTQRPPSSRASPSSSSLPSLPFDILVTISSLLPLPSLLALASTSRTLRSSLLSSPTKRNCLASAWLNTWGRYWLPLTLDLGVDLASDKPAEEKEVRVKKVELLELGERDGWWDYLRRCAAESGSMRNRKRVWETALSIEAAVEREGLL